MKLKLISALILSFSFGAVAQAQHARVESFTIVRSGGGPMEVKVDRAAEDLPQARIVSCNFRTLTPEEAANSTFLLNRDEENAALAILNNRAVFATPHPIEAPGRAGGTWRSVKVEYSYRSFNGELVLRTANISNPQVLLDGKVSDALDLIEKAARKALASISACSR